MYQHGATWYADGDIDNARKASYYARNSGIYADSFSWWGNKGCGTICKTYAGIAYIGGLCRSSGFNTNLNEKQSTYAKSGYVS